MTPPDDAVGEVTRERRKACAALMAALASCERLAVLLASTPPAYEAARASASIHAAAQWLDEMRALLEAS
jgi:hypothetical protein